MLRATEDNESYLVVLVRFGNEGVCAEWNDGIDRSTRWSRKGMWLKESGNNWKLLRAWSGCDGDVEKVKEKKFGTSKKDYTDSSGTSVAPPELVPEGRTRIQYCTSNYLSCPNGKGVWVIGTGSRTLRGSRIGTSDLVFGPPYGSGRKVNTPED